MLFARDIDRYQCDVQYRSKTVAFISRDLLFREIYVGNTTEITRPSTRSSIFI